MKPTAAKAFTFNVVKKSGDTHRRLCRVQLCLVSDRFPKEQSWHNLCLYIPTPDIVAQACVLADCSSRQHDVIDDLSRRYIIRNHFFVSVTLP